MTPTFAALAILAVFLLVVLIRWVVALGAYSPTDVESRLR